MSLLAQTIAREVEADADQEEGDDGEVRRVAQRVAVREE